MGGVFTRLLQEHHAPYQSQVFSTAADNQTQVTIKVFQMCPRLWSHSTSKKQSITIRSSGGLSDTNVEKMVQETVIYVALRRFSWGAMAGDALMSGVYRVDFRLSGLAANTLSRRATSWTSFIIWHLRELAPISTVSRRSPWSMPTWKPPVLRSEISAAQERTYSLMQLVSDVGLRTTAGIQGLVVITAVRRPAEKEHQLASHIFVVMKIVARTGENSFGEVSALITDLIERLHKEASAETNHKAYHHKKMATSTENNEDLEAQVAKHFPSESAVARSYALAGEVSELQADLGALAAQQLKMDALRGEGGSFATAREDLKQRIAGVQRASVFSGILWSVFFQQPDAPEVHTISILEVIEPTS